MLVIGDIHGCFKTFQALLEKCPKDDVCLVGDLIDRGPMSKDVVQYVIDNNIPCVKGNHEDMMVKSLINEDARRKWEHNRAWMMNGAFQTKESYNNDEILLLEHATWMSNLPLYLEFTDLKDDKGRHLVVSHSSVGAVWNWTEKKRTEMKETFESVIMWDRNPPKDVKTIYNVFGHTINVEPRIKSFYANIDTGAIYHEMGYGTLTALQWPSMNVYTQDYCD